MSTPQLATILEPGASEPGHTGDPNTLRALALEELLALEIKPREMVLGPVIPEKGLAMIYGPRGTGKTFLALSIAYAVASGGSVLRWSAPRPRRVLYVDGEMPMRTLQERLSAIVAGSDAEPEQNHLMFLPADYYERGIPNLGHADGQAVLDPLLEGIELLVIDNVSTLLSVGRDNEVESWAAVQEWLLGLRRRGISVLLIHHAAKGGQQRGTSRREDVLDTSISLKRPDGYSPKDGARFEVHLEKARGVFGEEAAPFEAKAEQVAGALHWTTRDLTDDLGDLADLSKQGLSTRKIAGRLGLSKSAVDRKLQKAHKRAQNDGNDSQRDLGRGTDAQTVPMSQRGESGTSGHFKDSPVLRVPHPNENLGTAGESEDPADQGGARGPE